MQLDRVSPLARLQEADETAIRALPMELAEALQLLGKGVEDGACNCTVT